MMQAPYLYPDIRYFFDVAGYGAGKSFTIVQMIIRIAWLYMGHEVVVGVGGDTITRLRKTVLLDLQIQLHQLGVGYTYNVQQGIVTIGTVQFMLVNTSQPEQIYGTTYSIFLCDELDELKQEDALAAFKAIAERTRKTLPDGRSPFEMFFTTAQGYRGTYQIITELEEKKTPHVHVRGRTIENKANSADYYTNLYSIYNEMERRVFLEGEFANLTTGRVYYGYDEAMNRLKEAPFTIEPNDLIRIGQDFNAGYSRGCAVVKRGGVLHVVHLFDFAEIGHAPSMIRTAFPPHVIEWYPDASSMEIVTGYSKEIREAGIQCMIGTINPSVIDRIYFINKLFETKRLFLWPNCGALSMALKVRQFNDKGDPEKGKGPEAPDHWADSLEYVIWRIVWHDPEFQALWGSSRIGRRSISYRLIA